MVGGSLRVLRLLPPLTLVARILLKVALNTKNQSIIILKNGFMRGWTLLIGAIYDLVVFYYLSLSEKWLYKRGGLS
jgi:hypothetical protein